MSSITLSAFDSGFFRACVTVTAGSALGLGAALGVARLTGATFAGGFFVTIYHTK
jgi:hypothetical protein